MKELIGKRKTLADLKGIKDVIQAQGDTFLANINGSAIDCIQNQPVVAISEVKANG